ncbi:hypothetical protein [Pelagibius sp.]|uniref:hypothetical protein n=1 Tax=Pelagibius sp. TaxID=1931238 RepID=UPI00260CDB3B|nr:hypothetical protein [Pelagibius sp.]
MTHEDLLECNTDAPIGPQDRGRARTLDRMIPVRRPRIARVRCRLKAYKPAGLIESMARTLVRVKQERGTCDRMDLVAQGFSLEAIDKFSLAAVQRARGIEQALR